MIEMTGYLINHQNSETLIHQGQIQYVTDYSSHIQKTLDTADM